MFAADQEKTASELTRVCKRGGKVGLSCWTPDSSFGEFSRLVATYLPSPPNTTPPMLWGSNEGIEQLFGDRISSLRTSRRTNFIRYPSPKLYLEHSKKYFGPLIKAYDSLDEIGQINLAKSIMEWVGRHNRSTDETVLVPTDYLEIIATKVS